MRPPTGLSPLLAFRTSGKLPSRVVSIDLGDEWKDPDWFKVPDFLTYPSGVIRSTDSLEELDLRVLKGLHVFIHAQDYSKKAARLFEAIKGYADYVCLVVLDWGDDFGIDWRRA
jgi:hypothetical protein